MSSSEQRSVHVPVMPREVLQWLQLSPGLTVLDGTVGAGGHSHLILRHIGSSGRLIGLDRDPMMLEFARRTLPDPNCTLINATYADADAILRKLNVPTVDRVLLDLGLSSDQLSDRNRGFGFDAGGPLDMRFNPASGSSAAELLATCSASELEHILSTFGEEPDARRMATGIVSRRERGRSIVTAHDLANCIEELAGGHRRQQERHPATRVFQALRIAVNQELDQVQRMLTQTLPGILSPGGVAVIISFHSLEDRLVKNALKEQHGWQVLTKTPVGPTPAEIRLNPRSRSAKLRAAIRNPPL